MADLLDCLGNYGCSNLEENGKYFKENSNINHNLI